MSNQKTLPIIKGMIKHLPFVKSLLKDRTAGGTGGGALNSRYCYSVWMRHFINWRAINSEPPGVVAELGPGESLGVGIAALLSGSTKYYALDVIKYWDSARNVKIFDELVQLFKERATIPDNKEFFFIRPELNDYSFPVNLLSDEQLKKYLSPDRLESIRNEIINIDNPNNKFIHFQIPWYDAKVIEKQSVDLILSQAVLEHVEDLENTYKAMTDWIKPSGLMTHSIDFKSHGITKAINGHWTFSDLEWKIVKGGKSFEINRAPFTAHIELNKKYGFEVLKKSFDQMKNEISRKQLSKRFSSLTEEELTTSAMYILSRKK